MGVYADRTSTVRRLRVSSSTAWGCDRFLQAPAEKLSCATRTCDAHVAHAAPRPACSRRCAHVHAAGDTHVAHSTPRGAVASVKCIAGFVLRTQVRQRIPHPAARPRPRNRLRLISRSNDNRGPVGSGRGRASHALARLSHTHVLVQIARYDITHNPMAMQGMAFTDLQLHLLQANNIGPDTHQLTLLVNTLKQGNILYLDFLFSTKHLRVV